MYPHLACSNAPPPCAWGVRPALPCPALPLPARARTGPVPDKSVVESNPTAPPIISYQMSCQSSKGYAKTACCDTHATLLAPDAASDRSSDLLQALLADEKDADAGVEHDVPHDSTLSLSAGRARADPSSSQALAMPSLSSFDVVFQCLSGRFQVVEHNGHLDFVVKGRLIHVQREACDNGCCEKGTAFDHGPAVKESGSAASSGDVVLQVFGGTKETTRIYCGGICCPSEVPIVNRAIGRLPGVVSHKVAVVSRTVVVEHNASLISGDELVDTLNRAGLEASLASEAKRRLGGDAKLIEGKDWLVVVSGILLVAAVLHYIPGAEHLKWFALGSVALALPSIAYKAVLAMRLLVIDINMLMLLAIAGALALQVRIHIFRLVWFEAMSMASQPTRLTQRTHHAHPKTLHISGVHRGGCGGIPLRGQRDA